MFPKSQALNAGSRVCPVDACERSQAHWMRVPASVQWARVSAVKRIGCGFPRLSSARVFGKAHALDAGSRIFSSGRVCPKSQALDAGSRVCPVDACERSQAHWMRVPASVQWTRVSAVKRIGCRFPRLSSARVLAKSREWDAGSRFDRNRGNSRNVCLIRDFSAPALIAKIGAESSG